MSKYILKEMVDNLLPERRSSGQWSEYEYRLFIEMFSASLKCFYPPIQPQKPKEPEEKPIVATPPVEVKVEQPEEKTNEPAAAPPKAPVEEPAPVKPAFVAQLMRPSGNSLTGEAAQAIVNKAVNSLVEAKPAETQPYVTVAEQATDWLREQLKDGERWSREINIAAEGAGFNAPALTAARKALGVESRPIPGGKGWATSLPGEKRLIQAAKIESEISAKEEPEQSIPDKPVTSEPLSPESYSRRRDALEMTDSAIAYWVETVGEGALQLYSQGKNMIGQDAARRVETLLAKMEAETDASRLSAYRKPYAQERAAVVMGGSSYAKHG